MLSSNALQEATSRVRQMLAHSPGSWDAASETELVELLGAAAELCRAVDALRVSVAGAVSRRSEGFNRAESFAARLGFRGTKPLLMQAFGVQAPTADILISLAQATAPRSGFSAGELPPFRPALAAALQAGELSADQAAAVHRELPHPTSPESVPGMIAAAEVSLVAEATGGRVDLSRPSVPKGDARLGTGFGAQGVAATPNPSEGAAGDPPAGFGSTPSGTTPPGTGLATASAPAPSGLPAGPWGHPPAGDLATGIGARDTDVRDQDPWGGRRLEVHHVRNQAKVWANHIDPDGPEPRYEEQRQRRALRLRAARGGGYTLSGFAPETEGALLLSVLDGFTAPGSRRGEAASTLGAGQHTPDNDASSDAPADRSSDQQNFDALHAMVEEHVRSGASAAGVGASSALVVTVTLSALAEYLVANEAGLVDGQGSFAGAVVPGGLLPPLDGELRRPETGLRGSVACPPGEESFPPAADKAALGPAFTTLETLARAREARLSRTEQPIPLSALAARLCEDAVGLLITDDAGSPLAYGRSRRLFSPQQRRVLTVRDGGCRAPGCNAPPGWCHAHHVIPWERGGPSDVDNAVLLCSFHHHEVHRGRLVALPAQGGNGSPRIVCALTARALERRGATVVGAGVGPRERALPTPPPSPTPTPTPTRVPPSVLRSASAQAFGLGGQVWTARLPRETAEAWSARYRRHHHVRFGPAETNAGRPGDRPAHQQGGHPVTWQGGSAGGKKGRRHEVRSTGSP